MEHGMQKVGKWLQLEHRKMTRDRKTCTLRLPPRFRDVLSYFTFDSPLNQRFSLSRMCASISLKEWPNPWIGPIFGTMVFDQWFLINVQFAY